MPPFARFALILVVRRSWQVGRAFRARRGGSRCFGTRPTFFSSVSGALLILAGVLASAAFLPAQTPPASAAATNLSGPRIQFNTENYDFGKVLAGDTVKYSFIVTNSGDDTLEVRDVRTTCACAVVSEDAGEAGPAKRGWTPHKVPPGQTCRIHVEITTDHSAALPIAKLVTVASNDKTRPSVNLQIHGQVWLPIEVSPATAVFNTVVNSPSNHTQALRIFNRMATPLALSDPQSNTNAFSAVLNTNVPGQEFELTITAAPFSHPASAFAPTIIPGEISLQTSVTNRNPLKISILETVNPEITVYPTNIQLPPEPLPRPMTNHITVRGNSADLAVSDLGANFPGAEISLNVIRTNRQYYVAIVFPAGFDVRASQNAALTFRTDNPAYPLVTVPVAPMRLLVRPAPVTPPRRTGVLPASVTTGAATNSPGVPAPSPNAAERANPVRP
jgi:hypothetical protein